MTRWIEIYYSCVKSQGDDVCRNLAAIRLTALSREIGRWIERNGPDENAVALFRRFNFRVAPFETCRAALCQAVASLNEMTAKI
jgi:hypothetical protein